MCSTCGASPSGALASSAARWRTPKRCCSSTTATASDAKRHVGLDQRVGADDQPQLAAAELAQRVGAARGGRRAGQQRGRHAPRRASAPEASRSAARPAPPSAPSAPPGGRARRPGASRASATTVLPEPTSPISSRCIGCGCARSPAIVSIARAWSPVGSNGRMRRRASARRARRPRPPARAPRPRRGGAGAGAAGRAGRAAAPRRPAGAGRPRDRRRARRSARRAGRAADAVRAFAPAAARATSRDRQVLANQREDLRRREALGRRIVGDLAAAPRPARWSGRATSTRKRLRASNVPCSTSRVPAGYFLTSHGWLKNATFMLPVSSATTASTIGRMPRRRTGAS